MQVEPMSTARNNLVTAQERTERGLNRPTQFDLTFFQDPGAVIR